MAIERYGGRLGIKSQDKLHTVFSAPQQIIFGAELYGDIASKAAVMGFQMLKNRPFLAANEATALLAMLRFLHINDVPLTGAMAEGLAAQLRAVLASEIDRDGLTQWLRDQLEVGVNE